jgi:type I restriction enzyme, S subunit
MIRGLKPYLAMRDSGVQWLTDLPAHWNVGTLRRSLKPYDGIKIGPFGSQLKLEQMTEEGLKVYGQVNVIAHDFSRGNKFVSEAKFRELSACEIRPGDLVVTMMGTSGRCARVPETASPGLMDSHLIRLRTTSELHPPFAALVIDEAPYVKQQISVAGKGSIMHGLNSSIIKNLQIVLPPIAEQIAIVHFFDYADRRIRRYIRNKQKLIKLLEEQKQAVIDRAVTQGLGRNGALKHSGFEWLGDAPDNWDVIALRRKWKVTDCKHVTVPFVDDGIPVASVREAQSFELSFERSNHTTPEWYEKLIEGGRTPRAGDLIYCRNVSVGAAALVTTEARFAMGQDVCLIRSESENQRWLNYFLRSSAMSDQLALILVGSTFNRINVEDIKALLIPVPPRNEQDRIAAFLDKELREIDAGIELCRREQALLVEYRIRLIADLVTGKLDVREASANIPDQQDEPEDLLPDEILAGGDEADLTEGELIEEEVVA